MTTRDTNLIRKALVDVTACLTAELEDPENGVSRPCRVMIIPGESAMPEYQGPCDEAPDGQPHDCGFAWVRLMTVYQATSPGVVAIDNGNCANARMGFDLNLGITRCFPLAQDPKYTPSPAEVESKVFDTVADMMVLWKTLTCCDALPAKQRSLGAYQPLGPAGGLVGGTWNVSVIL